MGQFFSGDALLLRRNPIVSISRAAVQRKRDRCPAFALTTALEELKIRPQSATEITKNAISGECQVARRSLDAFCAFLGSFAGNVALTFGARGGLYIAGGISPRILDFLIRSEFRKRFEAKGRFRNYLEAIPSYVITHPAAALIGLKSLVE